MKKVKITLIAFILFFGISNVSAISNPEILDAKNSTYVARIGEIQYESLDDAISNAKDNDEIILLANVTTNGMNLNKNIIIDGKSHNITFNSSGIALWGKTLTFKNTNIEMKGISSTPYKAEWNWMSICASLNSKLSLINTTMTLDGSNTETKTHAIYFTGNDKLELTNSKLIIKNYSQDALEWDGGDGGYNVTLNNSTFISDHNRSGITGTFYFKANNSNVEVINSTGNGSNGSHFELNNSNIKFNNNRAHGLSTSNLIINNSQVVAENNGGNGIHVNGLLNITNTANITIKNNECAISSKWTFPGALLLTSDNEHNIDKTSTVTIKNNFGSGISLQKGSLNIQDGANVTITDNTAYKLGFGGGIYVGTNNVAKLSDSVTLYNNHAPIAGDDIYSVGNITIPKINKKWHLKGTEKFQFNSKYDNSEYFYNLIECQDNIDGWYDDSEENGRWDAHNEDESKLHFVEYKETSANELLSLKAAHGIYGKVIAQYVDTKGNVLNPDIITSGKYNDSYKTSALDIENYKLVNIKGNETGHYGIKDIYVIYVYDSNDLPVISPDPNIPITGITDNFTTETIMALSIVSLIGAYVIRRRYN